VRFSGDSSASGAPEIERAQFTGNLHTLYEATLGFIRRYCDLFDTRPPRKSANEGEATDQIFIARANYKREVICEALANALSHRDLALRDHSTRVHIYDRSIEIINPRRTAGFTPAWSRAIRYGVPQRLNPQLHAVFINRAYGIELPHGGLPMLLRQSRLFSSRRPEIHVFNDEFRLRIYGI
jgi:predicted HTH transcriptional regulator